ncbi:MAG: glycosyltransferase family 2 protein [Acidimicrobiales bacterium]
MPSHETIAVVVVTYNSAPLISGLVESLGPGLAGLEWHLTVVDNASHDDTVAQVNAAAPYATVVQTGRNAGYAAGINAGLAACAHHTAVLVLNPDVRLGPGCGAILLRELRVSGTGIAVPLLLDRFGKRIDSQRREPTIMRAVGDLLLGSRRAGRFARLGQVVTAAEEYERPAVVDWAEGSTLMISAECLEKVGSWDESFFLYSEETEFALRARDGGFVTRFTPHAWAVHLEGGSATSLSLWPLVVTNWVRLFRRRHALAPSIMFWTVILLRETSRAAIGKKTSRRALRVLLNPKRLCEVPGPHSIRP